MFTLCDAGISDVSLCTVDRWADWSVATNRKVYARDDSELIQMLSHNWFAEMRCRFLGYVPVVFKIRCTRPCNFTSNTFPPLRHTFPPVRRLALLTTC